MIDLTEFNLTHNFKVDGKTSYGVYRDRVLTITPMANYLKATITFNEQISREKAQNISMRISKIKKDNKVLQRGLTNAISVELMFYSSATLQTEFFQIIDKVYDELEQCDLNKCNICPLCGKEMPAEAAFLRIKDGVLKAHDPCIDQLLDAASQFEKGTFVDDKKVLGKALLANTITMIAITAIIALLSLAGLYIYISIIAGWIFTVVIKTVLFKCKVPLSTKYLLISSAFAILTVVASIFFGSAFYIYMESASFGFSESLTLGEVFKLYPTFFTTHYEKIGNTLLVDFLLSLLFVGVSIFFDFKKAKTQKNSIKKL